MMLCRITDMGEKDVINVCDGTRLGSVCDVEVDTVTAQIMSIVIFGRYRLFGLLGREDDVIIPWKNIQVIGEDTVLVNCPGLRGNERTPFWRKPKGW